jgi:hypothetical protein
MLQQLPKLAPLFFAVAFGSSLDISAIQTESPEPLDYNKQLSTIGHSFCFSQLQTHGRKKDTLNRSSAESKYPEASSLLISPQDVTFLLVV